MFYHVETKHYVFVYYSGEENPENEIIKFVEKQVKEKAEIIGISPWEAEQLITEDKVAFRVW